MRHAGFMRLNNFPKVKNAIHDEGSVTVTLQKGALSESRLSHCYTDSQSNTFFFSYTNLMVNSSNESFPRIWRSQILGITFKYLINIWNSSFALSDTVQQKTLQNYKVLFLTGVLTGQIPFIWFHLLSSFFTEKQMFHINSCMKFTRIPRKLYERSKFSRQTTWIQIPNITNWQPLEQEQVTEPQASVFSGLH